MDELTTEELFHEIAKRYDGVVLVVFREPTETTPEKLTFYDCGSRTLSSGMLRNTLKMLDDNIGTANKEEWT